MLDIVLTRIDDRLIHGQVMTAWVKYSRGNRIIIVDDLVAKDDFIKSMLKMSIPPGLKLDTYTVTDAVDVLNGDAHSNEKVIILVKKPDVINELIQKGVRFKEINVGGMGANPGRRKLYKNISASDEEREIFKKITEAGINVSIRIIPDDREVSVEKIL